MATEVGICRHVRGGIRLLIEIDGDFVCGSSRSHKLGGKSLDTTASTLRKWALKLRMVTSAEFRLWHPGGTNSMLNLCVSRIWFFMFSETLVFIEYVFLWDNACLFQSVEEHVICPYHLCIFAIFHGFDKDGIAVDFDHHHDVFVASLQACRELACLVREHGFAYLIRFGAYIVYFLAMELRGVACFEWDRLFVGGAYVFLSLI